MIIIIILILNIIEGNLKITDFGLATLFKYKGVTRRLTSACGTPPYVAPEVKIKLNFYHNFNIIIIIIILYIYFFLIFEYIIFFF